MQDLDFVTYSIPGKKNIFDGTSSHVNSIEKTKP